MRTDMRTTGTIWLALVVALVGLAPAAGATMVEPVAKALAANTCDPSFGEAPCETELIAGQEMDVGRVTVESDGLNVIVRYLIDDPDWFITETHLYVGTEPPARPSPGQFPYHHTQLNTMMDEYVIPLADLGVGAGDCLTFAAHAVVAHMAGYGSFDLEAFAAALPDQVYFRIYSGADSYFNALVSGGTILDGLHDSWCIDTDNNIGYVTYLAWVYSSYEPLPPGLIEYPENLDLVNYIINQGYIGQPAACGGTFTMRDIQVAIWTLMDDEVGSPGAGPWAQCRVDEILADAYANGEGFTPGCGDLIAVVLEPVNGAQVIIIEVEIPCEPVYEGETAWGFGPCAFGRGWGWYFACCTQP